MSKVESRNSLNLTRADYKAFPSTLCTGCGHDSITNQLITALYQSDYSPYDIVKLSGIGCASKTPAYFLSQSHGFNSIHGRMAPLATGVHMANSELKIIGVSGDGDTASIGLGGFAHMIRRNIPIVYIIANNGVYGLTKGQFSATASFDHKAKSGALPSSSSIDICRMALDLGCGFVARGFSGDMKQMTSILSAALRYNGTAVIDVVSPCVTYANHEGSTKSYDYVKDHTRSYHEVEFLTHDQIEKVDYEPGTIKDVKWPDGALLRLKKTTSELKDLNDVNISMKALRDAENENIILTGIFHLEMKKTLKEKLQFNERLYTLSEKHLKIEAQTFNNFLNSFY